MEIDSQGQRTPMGSGNSSTRISGTGLSRSTYGPSASVDLQIGNNINLNSILGQYLRRAGVPNGFPQMGLFDIAVDMYGQVMVTALKGNGSYFNYSSIGASLPTGSLLPLIAR